MSNLVNSFLGAAMQLSAAFTSPEPTQVNLQTSEPVQTADIGGWFNGLNQNNEINRSIIELDEKFQTFLYDLYDKASEDPAFAKNIYSAYGDKSRDLGIGYELLNPQDKKDIDIDPCTADQMKSLFDRTLDKLENYFDNNPDIAASDPLNYKIIELLRNQTLDLSKSIEAEGIRNQIKNFSLDVQFPCGKLDA